LIDFRDYGKGKNVPVHVLKAYSRSGGTALLILNLGTRWQCVVFIFMSRLLTPVKKTKSNTFTVGRDGPRAELDHFERGKSLYGDFGFYDDKAGRLRWAGPARHIKYIKFPWGCFEK